MLEIKAKASSGNVNTFRCEEIISINSTSFDDFIKESAKELLSPQIDFSKDALLNLDGRLSTVEQLLGMMVQGLAQNNLSNSTPELIQQLQNLLLEKENGSYS